ncbi:MAG: hypothetical protein IPL52_05310 [Flavobacteriales bacterium]|nr:hypothetical protein [Flavobacteriales bacterium]
MRILTLPIVLLVALTSSAQLLSFEEWQIKSEEDIRLQPRYGDRGPSEMNAAIDEDVFVAITNNRNRQRAISDSLLQLGLQRLKKNDHVHAMERFNEAWLAMPINPDVHRAFGMFFRSMKRPLEAHEHYEKGIAMDTTNAPLMKEHGQVYMEERYYYQQEGRSKQADAALLKALELFTRAYRRMGKDPELTYDLFVCHTLNLNCPKAWEFHDKVVEMNARTVEDMYLNRLKAYCVR